MTVLQCSIQGLRSSAQEFRVSTGSYEWRLPAEKRPAEGASDATLTRMTRRIVGYARVSTNERGLTAQRNALAALEVPEGRISVDH